ncbi:hypothetical protein [Anaerocellum diazotrophicum]|uniref:Uncharacterized protein n=1 Tax=Caldicellulosiruptor diazotrophicus TaxID=2806205 RepID=A0ABN6E4U9_9FIRM|nr:hypothetical protein [Caldicellulosiruptor diazotrophicus]BCS80356.1 hypothetical protein CaldiYA01_03160 [Caldicellulosiruptor diazotrophicus]
MKRRRKTLLMIVGITLILIAIILAIAFEKALNSVLPPEMVKELLNDKSLNKELSSLINDENIAKDVQSAVYDQDKLKKDLAQAEGSNAAVTPSKPAIDKNLPATNEIKGKTGNQDSKSQELSNAANTNNKFQSSLNKNTPKNEQNSSSPKQDRLSISTSDQLEAAKIVLSVMSMGEIKELVSLYKSGKKNEAIQRGVMILKQRLSPEQKKRLMELYFKYK